MKIHLFDKLASSGCGWYRTIGVLPYIDNVKLSLNEVIENGNVTHYFNYVHLLGKDILFIGRPSSFGELYIIRQAKELGVKVVADYDDNLLAVNPTHPKYEFWSSSDTQYIIKSCIEASDLVIVSTESIREEFSVYNNNVHVVPNAFNSYNIKPTKKYNNNKNIMWRGGESHNEDVDLYAEQIIEFFNRNKEYTLHWVGMNHDLLDKIDNKVFYESFPNWKYFNALKEINPSIVFVPLARNKFNEGKSNIAWIEATTSGAIAITPDFGVYRTNPYTIKYEEGDLYSGLVNAINLTPEKHHRLWHWSMSMIPMLNDTNDMRYKLLKEAISTSQYR